MDAAREKAENMGDALGPRQEERKIKCANEKELSTQ
jgi:hypothetical protein